MVNKNIEILINELLTQFPDFSKKMDPEDFSPYSFFGDLGIYLRDAIDSNSLDENSIKKIFEFLNKMGSSEDLEVHNLLTVGVLEILTDSEKAMKTAKEYLRAEALEDLHLIDKFWHRSR